MKKGNTFVIILSIFSIVALLALSVYLTLFMMDDSSSLKRFLPGYDSKDATASSPEQHNAASVTEAAASSDNSYPEHHFIIIGDSRTAGMQLTVNELNSDSCIYIAKEGEGYDWFYNDGLPQMETAIKDNPKADVVFNLGVNDLKNLSLYIDLYNLLMDEYNDTSFYLMSVNPVDESYTLNISNSEINAFNESIENSFSKQYLDCYNQLLNDGFTTVDGLHYSKDTYRAIHSFLIDKLS